VLFEDIFVKLCADTHPSDVAEESFDSDRFLLLDDCHEMQLKELDHKLHPLQVVSLELDVFASSLLSTAPFHRYSPVL